MASHATDVPAVPVLLSEVRAVKQEDGGDIGDEGRGSRRESSLHVPVLVLPDRDRTTRISTMELYILHVLSLIHI